MNPGDDDGMKPEKESPASIPDNTVDPSKDALGNLSPNIGSDTSAESQSHKDEATANSPVKEINRQDGALFLKAAERGDIRELQRYIDKVGVPVNYQDPLHQETALHIVAACRARKALRLLLKTGQINFLLRDRKGRLASEMAYLYGRDPAVARLLGIKEKKQGAAQGIKVTRRPRP